MDDFLEVYDFGLALQLLFPEQGFRVGLINGLIQLADLAFLSFGIATNPIGEHEFTHVEITQVHELLFSLFTQIFFGQGHGDTR